jgi:hypothetical protein
VTAARFRLPAEPGPFRHTGQIVSTARGEHDLWYTLIDDQTGQRHTLPWHMVAR